MAVPFARRTILHHRRRFAAALLGVIFAVVLANLEVGILSGFMANAVVFIERMPADVWVMAPSTPNFDMCHNIPESHAQRAGSAPGALWAEKMLVAWGAWQTPGGTIENTEVVGLVPGGHLGIPWEISPAGAGLSDAPDGAIIDRTDRRRLQVDGPGDCAELTGARVRVLGFTSGMRSFTTNPYVLMRYEDAEKASRAVAGMTSYVLVKAAPGVSPEALRDAVRRELPEADVLTAAEFGERTRNYWLFGTGVGSAFLLTALLGFLVGGAIVWQVLHALVQDQRAEFGVLKAMGAGAAALLRIVGSQALIVALAGGLAGEALSLALAEAVRASGSPILLDGAFSVATVVAAVLVCLAAAALPMVRVLRLEPAVVFRG